MPCEKSWREQDFYSLGLIAIGRLRLVFQHLWRGSREDKSRIFTEVHDSRMTDNGYKLHQKRFLLDIGKTKQIVSPGIIGACYSARLWSLHSWVFSRPDLIKPWSNCSVLTGDFGLSRQLAIRPLTILSFLSSSLIPRCAKNIKVKSIYFGF